MVVFQMHEKYGREEFGDVEMNVVFPVEVKSVKLVLAVFGVVVKAVELGGVKNVLPNRLLIVYNHVDTNHGS